MDGAIKARWRQTSKELSPMNPAKGLWARYNKIRWTGPPIGPLVSLKGHFDQSKDCNLLTLSIVISQRYAVVC